MKDTIRAELHPDEGELVRYMDHQVSVEDRRWMLSHLSACDACALRLRSLGDRSSAVAGYLTDLHAGVTADEMTRARALSAARAAAARAGRRSVGWMRAAAVAAIVVVTVGVSPLRAWVLDRVSATFDRDQPTTVAIEKPSVTVLERGSRISFAPSKSVFVLELQSGQATGEVEFRLGSEPRVSAQVVGRSGDESFTILPSGVLVENGANSTASYQVEVPSSIRTVQLFAGGKLLAVLDVEAGSPSWSRSIPLAGNR